MIAGEVDAGFGDQRCQPCDEIHRFESHLGRSIAVGRLQGIDHLAGRAEREAGNGNGGAGDVPAQPLAFVFLLAFAVHPGVEGESIGLGHPLQCGIRSVRGRMVRIMNALRPCCGPTATR